MNQYTISALIAFVLFGMGLIAVMLGGINYSENKKSYAGKLMMNVCACVFFWDAGYAWMSLCFEDSFAYVPRAVALLAVTFYMYFILKYVSYIVHYPKKTLTIVLALFASVSIIAWLGIIGKNAIQFVMTPWGYWYISRMSISRILQFASVIVAIAFYYVILQYGKKRATFERERFIIGKFGWFGVILFTGYIFDTLLPTILHIPAIPGSAVSAFFSAMLLYYISRSNKAFGLSKDNVSEYVFQDVTIPVIIVDHNLEIVLFNNNTMEYLQCTERDLIGTSIRKFFSYIDITEGEQEEYAWRDESLIHLAELKQNDGKVCRLAKTRVRDRFNDLLYEIYFVQDLTRERETLRMLEESREQAEEANQAKSNFLANMSHEIRTPMNAIIGMSDIILQDNDVPEKIRNRVREIQIAGNNLLSIINDILDISKIEAGKYELIEDEYELPSLINDVSNIIDVRLTETKVQLLLEVDCTLPFKLTGDVKRIRQVLLNILGNAVKFTHEGNITWKITWNHDEYSPELMFDISDTGIGIKNENLKDIFGAFNQVDTRRNRNIQGTGLGLAISKQLAELMGGSLTVSSVYGEGSTFYIRIKQTMNQYSEIGMNTAKLLYTHSYIASAINNEIEIIERPNAKILIVDDNRMNLLVAKGVMKKYNMQIDTASGGLEAVAKVQEKDYDIVFMDHMMPEVDGIDATNMIRALGGKYEKLVIIALTANAINDAREGFLNAGLQDFLSKPIERDALDVVINRWLPVE